MTIVGTWYITFCVEGRLLYLQRDILDLRLRFQEDDFEIHSDVAIDVHRGSCDVFQQANAYVVPTKEDFLTAD